jgi:haloalkane dehalogenase
MKSLRTPDSCFDGLEGYPFAPHYTEISDGEGGVLRVHHVDEGPTTAAPILLLHGQPTWSYLYRKMIPILADAGHRVIAPDLVGMGRSDKPSERSDYTYARHVAWFSEWLEANDLRDITLFCQDWGGLIGLRLVTAFPDRFARVIAANTGLPDGSGQIPADATEAMKKLYEELPVVSASDILGHFKNKDGPPGFLYWRKFCAESPDLRVSDVVFTISSDSRDEGVAAAYDAPFPGPEYMASARQFPSLVPIFADDPEIPANREAWKVLEHFEKPFMTAFSDSDPVTAGGERAFQKRVPGAKNVQHVTIENAGHFLQEQQPQACATTILGFIKDHPSQPKPNQP